MEYCTAETVAPIGRAHLASFSKMAVDIVVSISFGSGAGLGVLMIFFREEERLPKSKLLF
jgi:hypothetical protein